MSDDSNFTINNQSETRIYFSFTNGNISDDELSRINATLRFPTNDVGVFITVVYFSDNPIL